MDYQLAALSNFQIFFTSSLVAQTCFIFIIMLTPKKYPVEIHTNSVVIAAQNARSTYFGASDWFENALILYDIYWSTVAALIQLHADFQERKELYRWTTADEFEKKNELTTILTTRLNILNQIYNNNDPRCPSEDDQWINEQMKTVLLLGTHPSCSQDQCLCFSDVKLDMNDLVHGHFYFSPFSHHPADFSAVL